MYISRYLNISRLLLKKSFFLFGPRQTGKTEYIEHQLSQYLHIDLLDSDTFVRLSQKPSRLREEISPSDKIVVIDEIQKLPILLDEVHRLIQKDKINFLLTGSSARKLRTGGVNLLGGRARSRILHPFVWPEIKDVGFDLFKVISWGALPPIYLSESPREDLAAYVATYLKQEIAAEGLVRNLPSFSRFLEVAACCNGKILNYSNVSNDAQVPHTTVTEYFKILEDTLIGRPLEVWRQTKKRKPIATAKFYFFDTGIVRYLLNYREKVREKAAEFGDLFEAWMHHELSSYADYHTDMRLNYWRSREGYEVDFILNNDIAIEVKAKSNVAKKDLKGINALREEKLLSKYYVVSLEPVIRHVDDIVIIPWKLFLERLWNQEL